jgi:hypothetical protein
VLPYTTYLHSYELSNIRSKSTHRCRGSWSSFSTLPVSVLTGIPNNSLICPSTSQRSPVERLDPHAIDCGAVTVLYILSRTASTVAGYQSGTSHCFDRLDGALTSIFWYYFPTMTSCRLRRPFSRPPQSVEAPWPHESCSLFLQQGPGSPAGRSWNSLFPAQVVSPHMNRMRLVCR